MTAKTTAAVPAAASQELSPSGETPGAPRAGSKYPVQENPSLRQIVDDPGHQLLIFVSFSEKKIFKI